MPDGALPYDYGIPVAIPGTALAYRLVAGGRPLGTLVIGQGRNGGPDEVTGLVEDLGRRVALAIGAARQYARQATISAVLQRGLLPSAVAEIPGVHSALVHEPLDKGGPSGDFYDLFQADEGRWCFAIGDVQGKGPEAAVVIGLARPWLRLLAREGYRVADVLDRLNQLLLDDATEAADAAARALVAAGARPTAPGDGPRPVSCPFSTASSPSSRTRTRTRTATVAVAATTVAATTVAATAPAAPAAVSAPASPSPPPGTPCRCCSHPTGRSVPSPSRRRCSGSSRTPPTPARPSSCAPATPCSVSRTASPSGAPAPASSTTGTGSPRRWPAAWDWTPA
ncbi:hypothetical protein SHIRM173S_11463 [Streptomyces hirsutus]